MENYRFVEKIGKGSHGTVYLLESVDNKQVVCKAVSSKYKKYAYREIILLSKLSNKRIIQLIDTVFLKDNVLLLLEFMNFGSLESMIHFLKGQKSPFLGWSVLSQMGDAIFYLHTKKIIHRDIKPANILINKFIVRGMEYYEFKLCDFSLSTRSGKSPSDDKMNLVGTPFYMAPEMINRVPYDESIDCWGLGCSVYELLSGHRPFTGRSKDDLFKEINSKELSVDITADKGLNQLLKQCLQRKNRITSKELMAIEKIRLYLALMELKYKEKRIEELENQIKEGENI